MLLSQFDYASGIYDFTNGAVISKIHHSSKQYQFYNDDDNGLYLNSNPIGGHGLVSHNTIPFAYPSYFVERADLGDLTGCIYAGWPTPATKKMVFPVLSLVHVKHKGQSTFISKSMVTKSLNKEVYYDKNFKFVHDNCYVLGIDQHMNILRVYKNTTTGAVKDDSTFL